MKLYKTNTKEYYEFFTILNMDYDDVCLIEETVDPLLQNWKVPELTIANSGRCKKADVTSCLSTLLAIGQKTYDEIKDIFISEDVEVLPAKHKDDMYYIPRGLKAYEVDFDMKCMEDYSVKYYFNNEKLKEHGIEDKYFFRAETEGKMIVTETYFTQKFVDLLLEKKAKGFAFELIWDSDAE